MTDLTKFRILELVCRPYGWKLPDGLTPDGLNKALELGYAITILNKDGEAAFSFRDWNTIEAMREIVVALATLAYPQTPFIAGIGGDVDEYGFPETFVICNAYGSDVIALYRKEGNPSAPEW